MRMLNIDVEKMCVKHLCGEHLEMHMFVGCILKKKDLHGYISRGLVDISLLKKRHDEIAEEMWIRGYNHKSPLPAFKYKGEMGKVDVKESIKELRRRCGKCKF